MTMTRRTVDSAKRNSSKRRGQIDSDGLQVRLSYCGAQVIVQWRFDNDSSNTTISIIGVISAVHSISMNSKERAAGKMCLAHQGSGIRHCNSRKENYKIQKLKS